MMRRRPHPPVSTRYGRVPVTSSGSASALAPEASVVGAATLARPPKSARRHVARRVTSSIWKDPYRLALLGLVIDSTSHVSSYYLPIALMRPGLILFCLAIVFALSTRSRSIDFSAFRRRIPILIVLQGVIVCSSAVFGIQLGNSAHYIIDSYSKSFVLALLLVTSFRGIADLRRTIWALVLGGVVLAILAIFVVGISKRVGAITWDANDVGLIMVMSLPFLLLFAQTGDRSVKTFALVGVALAVATVIISGSRGAFLGMVAVGLSTLFFLPGVSTARRVAVVTAVGVAMVVFAPGSYWESIRRMTQPDLDYNWEGSGGRKEVAKRGVDYMLNYPVFGVGMNNFSVAEGTISPLARRYAGTNVGIKWSAPHNSWVQAGAETGIPGLLVWVALTVGSAVSVVKLRRRLPKSWLNNGTPDQRFMYLAALYLPIAFGGFLVCATFLSWAWNDPGYLLIAIAFGLHRSIEAVLPARVPVRSSARSGVGRRNAVPRFAG